MFILALRTCSFLSHHSATSIGRCWPSRLGRMPLACVLLYMWHLFSWALKVHLLLWLLEDKEVHGGEDTHLATVNQGQRSINQHLLDLPMQMQQTPARVSGEKTERHLPTCTESSPPPIPRLLCSHSRPRAHSPPPCTESSPPPIPPLLCSLSKPHAHSPPSCPWELCGGSP
jgi:hypothetical protein